MSCLIAAFGAFIAGTVIGAIAVLFMRSSGKLGTFDELLARSVELLDEAAPHLPRGSAIEKEAASFIEIVRQSRDGS